MGFSCSGALFSGRCRRSAEGGAATRRNSYSILVCNHYKQAVFSCWGCYTYNQKEGSTNPSEEAAHGRYAAWQISEIGRHCTPVDRPDRSITCKGIKKCKKRNPTERWWGFFIGHEHSWRKHALNEKRGTACRRNPVSAVTEPYRQKGATSLPGRGRCFLFCPTCQDPWISSENRTSSE